MTDGKFVENARERLGRAWGLGRQLTRAEMARALKLSDKHGGSHISKLESDSATLSGPVRTAIELMLDGGVPRHMGDVIKPGYPRGLVR